MSPDQNLHLDQKSGSGSGLQPNRPNTVNLEMFATVNVRAFQFQASLRLLKFTFSRFEDQEFFKILYSQPITGSLTE